MMGRLTWKSWACEKVLLHSSGYITVIWIVRTCCSCNGGNSSVYITVLEAAAVACEKVLIQKIYGNSGAKLDLD